jgi:hypothetical protein
MQRNETKPAEKGRQKLDRFIAALLTARNLEEAAAAAGISRTTGWRWLRNPEVVEKFREARRDSMMRALTLLQTAAADSVRTLISVQQDDGEAGSVRVSAAKAILDTALKAAELSDIEERLEKLEQIAKGRWKGDHDRPPNQTQAGTTRGVNGRG